MSGRSIALLGVILKAFLIQLLFDPKRMQGTGFLFSISSLLRELHRGEDLAEAYKRHLEYFNTHPYMASIVLGAVAAAEEEGNPEKARQIKRLLAPTLASLGDDFFWMVCRPLTAILGLQLLILGYTWGIVLFLVAYNLPHLFVRTEGFYYAYRFGLEGLAGMMRRLKPNRLILFAVISEAAFLGALGGVMVVRGYIAPVQDNMISGLMAGSAILMTASFVMMRLIGKARLSAPTWALALIFGSIFIAGLVEIW
jgi:PTS system mannose-specific IID component